MDLFLLGVTVMVALAACGGGAEEASPAEEPEAEEEMAEEEMADEEMAEGEEMMEEHTQSHVNVDDQDGASGIVVVGDIFSLEGPGWIVIHSDADGAPGPIVGFAPVDEGQNDNVQVEIDLSKATPTLYAMLHTDAGVGGEFEFPDGEDGPVRDAEGNVITPPFSVTLSDAVFVSDQAVASGTVTVDRVVYSGAGWIVIHAASEEGKPGPILGTAPVSAGVNTDVVVEVDEAGVTDMLFAMLHTDAGVEGEFEFPDGEDGPVQDAEGNVITPPFAVEAAEETSTGEGTVSIVDGSFVGNAITVSAGSTVVWTHNGFRSHTVTSDDGLFDSGTLSRGDTFSFVFNEPGTYVYHCNFHGGPGGQGMSGTITVTG